MKFLVTFLLLLPLKSIAACQYQLDQNGTTLNWTAFKTPKKVGVKAKFDKFSISSKDQSSVINAIKTANFSVESTSVNTGMPARDKKIVDFFFTKDGKSLTIAGNVTEVKGDTATVNLNFNGVQKPVSFKITEAKDSATLTSKIDILDFALSSQLAAINEACKALHEGKTWSDVELVLEAKFTSKCN